MDKTEEESVGEKKRASGCVLVEHSQSKKDRKERRKTKKGGRGGRGKNLTTTSDISASDISAPQPGQNSRLAPWRSKV